MCGEHKFWLHEKHEFRGIIPACAGSTLIFLHVKHAVADYQFTFSSADSSGKK